MQAWINGDDPVNVAAVAKFLNDSVDQHKSSEFKGFVIMLVDSASKSKHSTDLSELATKQSFNDIGMAVLDQGDRSIKAYKFKVDPEVKNTVIVYKNKTVQAKFVNLKMDEKGIAGLKEAIAKACQ